MLLNVSYVFNTQSTCKAVFERKQTYKRACLNGKDLPDKIKSTSKRLNHKSKNI